MIEVDSFERYLGDMFEIVDVLKSTEQSFVALVYDKRSQRVCTMKRRSLHSLEIYRTLKELDEPHVPEIYRLFERDGKLIVVEEHIDGQTLEEILIYQTVAVDEKFALEILQQLCECLAVIHKADIVHRDLKPSNVMLTKGNVVKLIDFGIARKFKPESLADTELLGTRGYASPEQFGLFDFGQTDARSDIYSLGITIKQLLGEDYRGWLLKILNRCTALEPTQRYQSVAELLDAVDNSRKLQKLKRGLIVGVVGVSVFALPVAVTEDIHPVEENQIVHVKPIEETTAEVEDVPVKTSSATLNQTTLNQLIDFAKTSHEPIESPPVIIPEELIKPSREEGEKNTVKPRESFDGVDLYLYLNGTLTGTDGSHIVDISDWKSWSPHSNGVLFPNGWNARLHIENHSGEDLIEPLITVSVNDDEYSVRKPSVKVGQSIDLEIPLANKFAAPLKGVGTLQIVLQAQGKNPIYLNRTFRIVQ